MQIRHSGKHGRSASSQSMGAERLVRRDQNLGMIGKAEIIIRTEINHRPRPAAVTDHCARIRCAKQLRFIQFNRPRANAHPVCKARWSLQRIIAFTRQEIAQTKFCRVLVHQMVHCLSLAPVPTDGPSQQS